MEDFKILIILLGIGVLALIYPILKVMLSIVYEYFKKTEDNSSKFNTGQIKDHSRPSVNDSFDKEKAFNPLKKVNA